jgi:hypothetical protein
MKNSTKQQVIFPFAQVPFSGESIASWVIRLCKSHDYSFQTVSKLVGIKLKKKDWDEGVTKKDIHALLQSAGLEYKQFFHGMLDPEFLRENHVQLWSRKNAGRPFYVFCKLCFKEDKEPYLRWRWRYGNFRKCTVHHCELLTCCPHCKRKLYTDSVILRDDSRRVFIPDFSYCKNCGQPMCEDNKNFINVKKPVIRQTRYVTPDIDPIDSIAFSKWFGISRINDALWRLYFGLPHEIDPLFKSRTNGLKQYRKLSIFSRMRVAKAVAVYRAERHRRRAEKKLAAQAAEPAK